MSLDKKQIIILVIIVILIIFACLLIWFNFPIEKGVYNNLMSPQEQMKYQVESIAAQFDFSMSEIELVEKIKSYGPDVIPILAEMIKDQRKETRYIAFIALSGLTNRYPDKRAELISYLKNGLTDSDATIKVQVAQLLLVWGEKDAMPILINALDNNQVMVPSEPQTSLNYYAYIILKQFTNVDFEYNKQQWQNWWANNQDKLV